MALMTDQPTDGRAVLLVLVVTNAFWFLLFVAAVAYCVLHP